MNSSTIQRHRGFTLIETVIAIGVLAVLLTGFIVVFTPATDGIRKSINAEHADRLASALEQELVNLRPGQTSTAITNGFSKAFEWIKDSNSEAPNSATRPLLVYQYRGKISSFRDDGTPEPEPSLADKLPGKDYIVVPMARRTDDAKLSEDLKAIEGAVYVVKCTQLRYNGTSLIKGTAGTIADPKNGTSITSADAYPATTIAFFAEFHMTPIKSATYFKAETFTTDFANFKNPVFTRHLSIRR